MAVSTDSIEPFARRHGRPQPWRRLVVLCLVLATVACAPRPTTDTLRPVAPASGASVVPIHVATDRALTLRDGDYDYGSLRAPGLNFLHVVASVPPGHQPGVIEWSQQHPDPGHSFAVTAHRKESRADFLRDLAPGPGRQDVLVFVHGYNTSLAEGVFRLAQIAHDSGGGESAILFSWPSRARLGGYVADREAALYARDHLVELLELLARDRRIGRITVLGHSMGGELVMEALRQLRLSGQDRTIAQLHVVLAAPDIDLDTFRAQLDVVGPMEPPLTLLVAADDGALRIASQLNAGRPRLGALDVSDPRIAEAARANRITLIDIGELGAAGVSSHSRFALLAALRPLAMASGTPRLAAAGVFVIHGVMLGAAELGY